MNKNFEQAYKELAQNEIPDLWDRIEAGLKEKSAPMGKEEEQAGKAEEDKGQSPVKGGIGPVIKMLKRYSGLAAAAVCAAVVIPAALYLGRNGNLSGSKSDEMEAIPEESAEAAAEEIAETGMESAEEEEMKESGMESAEAEEMKESGMESAEAEKMKEAGLESAAAGGMADTGAEAATEEAVMEAPEEGAADADKMSGTPSGAVDTAEKIADLEKRNDKVASPEGKREDLEKEMTAEDAQDTTFNHVVIEVKDIVNEKAVQDGTWYTATVKEDPYGYLKAEEQITVFAPAYSSIALIEGETFEVDMVSEKGEGYSFVLTKCHKQITSE